MAVTHRKLLLANIEGVKGTEETTGLYQLDGTATVDIDIAQVTRDTEYDGSISAAAAVVNTNKTITAVVTCDVIPEQLPIFLESGIKGDVTPTGDTAADGNTYVYAPPISGGAANKSLTLAIGDDVAKQVLVGAEMTEMGLTFANGEPLTMTANYSARSYRLDKSPATEGTLVQSTERLLSNMLELRFGGVEFDDVISGSITIPTGLTPQFRLNSRNVAEFTQAKRSPSFEFTVVHTPQGVTLLEAYDNDNTAMAFLARVTGSPVTSGGTNRSLLVTGLIRITDISTLSVDDAGAAVFTASGVFVKPPLGDDISITVVNGFDILA